MWRTGWAFVGIESSLSRFGLGTQVRFGQSRGSLGHSPGIQSVAWLMAGPWMMAKGQVTVMVGVFWGVHRHLHEEILILEAQLPFLVGFVSTILQLANESSQWKLEVLDIPYLGTYVCT